MPQGGFDRLALGAWPGGLTGLESSEPRRCYQHRPGSNQTRPRRGPRVADAFKPCAVDGCNKNARSAAGGARGWCRTHYKRWKRNGDPEEVTVTLGGATGICRVDGCNAPAKVKGMCKAHERRLRYYGSPTGKPDCLISSGDAHQWLRDRATHGGAECLTWPFAKGADGYGRLRTPDGRRTTASREMCFLAHGEPPTEYHQAAHSCGKGHEGCVNPAHLRWASNSENQMDRVEHGTSNRGERHGMSCLTTDQVRAIRALGGTVTQQQIADQFGVSKGTVYHILSRRTWEWL